MLIWCALLFGLGILAFLDSVLNMGEIFRRVNSVVFLLISLALLIRTSTKSRERTQEKFQERIRGLEREVFELKESQRKMAEF